MYCPASAQRQTAAHVGGLPPGGSWQTPVPLQADSSNALVGATRSSCDRLRDTDNWEYHTISSEFYAPPPMHPMFKSEDIHPITDFVRNHKRHHAYLRKTGRPVVLTINGTAELVLQDVHAYEREAEEAQRIREENRVLHERLEELETLGALDEAYAEMERGAGRSMEEALPALRDRLGVGVPAR